MHLDDKAASLPMFSFVLTYDCRDFKAICLKCSYCPKPIHHEVMKQAQRTKQVVADYRVPLIL